MKKLLIVVEKTADGYGGYAPDVPGVGVLGDTREETERLMREALEMHLDALRRDGQPVPEAHCYATYVEVGV